MRYTSSGNQRNSISKVATYATLIPSKRKNCPDYYPNNQLEHKRAYCIFEWISNPHCTFGDTVLVLEKIEH